MNIVEYTNTLYTDLKAFSHLYPRALFVRGKIEIHTQTQPVSGHETMAFETAKLTLAQNLDRLTQDLQTRPAFGALEGFIAGSTPGGILSLKINGVDTLVNTPHAVAVCHRLTRILKLAEQASIQTSPTDPYWTVETKRKEQKALLRAKNDEDAIALYTLLFNCNLDLHDDYIAS